MIGVLSMLVGAVSAVQGASPTIEFFNSPTEVNHQQQFTVHARATDSDGNLLWVNIDRNGTPFAYAGPESGVGNNYGESDNPWSADGPTTIVFTAWSVDRDGNESPRINHYVTVKAPKAPPTIWWTQQPGVVAQNSWFWIRADAHDSDGNMTTINIYRQIGNGGQTGFAYELNGNATNGWSDNQDHSYLPRGTRIRYTAQAFDQDGQQSAIIEQEVWVGYVNSVPSASISPATTNAFINKTFSFNVIASDPHNDLKEVRLYEWAWEEVNKGTGIARQANLHVRTISSAGGAAINQPHSRVGGTFWAWNYEYLALSEDQAGALSHSNVHQGHVYVRNNPPAIPTTTPAHTRIQLGQDVRVTSSVFDENGNLTFHDLLYKYLGVNGDETWHPWVAAPNALSNQTGTGSDTRTFVFRPMQVGKYLVSGLGTDPFVTSSVQVEFYIDDIPPDAPSNVSAGYVAWDRVQVQWTPSPTTPTTRTGYYLYWSASGGVENRASLGFDATSEWVLNLSPLTTYSFYVKAHNSFGATSPSSNVLSVTTPRRPPVITSPHERYVISGDQFDYQITAAYDPTSFNAVGYNGSSIPPGMNFQASGLISGRCSTVGSYQVKISATNSGGTGEALLTIHVTNPPPTIISALEVGWPRSYVEYQIQSNHPSTGYSAVAPTGFTIPEGATAGLPTGVALNAMTGLISGTPAFPGVYYVQISAYSNAGWGQPKILKITVADPPVIYSALSANAKRGLAFNYQISATNAPTTYNVVGTLPSGISFNTKTGEIGGKVGADATRGDYVLNITAANVSGSDTKQLKITIGGSRPVITSESGVQVPRGVALSYKIEAKASPTDGTISYSAIRADTGSVLPVAADGSITTSFAEAGTYHLKIRAANAEGQTEGILQVGVNEVTQPADTSGTPLAATLPGSFSVDNKGTANYVIPLELPRGRSGVEPRLAISYNSGGSPGLLGVGAVLSTGFSHSITRGRHILARDGATRGVKYDTEDKLYLDGKRLICVSGTPGAGGSTYRTEVDSFLTVSAYGSSTNIDGFKIIAKDGTVMYLGKPDPAVAPTDFYTESDGYHVPAGETGGKAMAWALKWVEDPLRNYIEFRYNETNLDGGANDFTLTPGEHLLTSIRYTGKKGALGTAPRYTVWLRYNMLQNQSGIAAGVARPDEMIRYEAGRYTSLSARLDELVVAEGSNFSTPSRTFRLKYNYGVAGSLMRLIEVMRRDPSASGTTSIATQFEWPGGAPGLTALSTQDLHRDDTSSLITSPSWTGDFNGDGRMDLLFRPIIGTGITIAWRTGTGGSAAWSERQAVMGAFPGAVSDWRLTTTGDFNGDGKTDLVWIKKGKGTAPELGGWYVTMATADGLGFEAPFRIVANNANIYSSDKVGATSSALALDIDGDGRDELMYQSKEVQHSIDMTGFFDNKFFIDDVFASAAAPRVSGSSTVLPNGKLFIVRRPPAGGTGVWTEKELPRFFKGSVPISLKKMDLDGDGRSDLLATAIDVAPPSSAGYSVDVTWTVSSYLNKKALAPTGDLDPEFELADTLPSHGGTITGFGGAGHLTLSGDVNGDGLEDLVNFSDSEGGWSVALSKGNGFFERGAFSGIEKVEGGVNTFFQQPGNVQTDANENGEGFHITTYEGFGITGALLMDFNGDGRKDFVWYAGTAGWQCFLSGRNGFNTAQALPVLGGNASFPYVQYRDPNTPELMCDATAVDATGEGRDSLLLFRRKSFGQPEWRRVATARNISDDPFRLTGITDGLGAKLKFQYGAITSDDIYTSGAPVAYPIREMRKAVVVSSVWKDDGTGANQHFTYQYSGARTDIGGRGFLGFHSFVTLDPRTKMFKYQFLAQSFPMTGLTVREETYRYWDSGNFRFISSHDSHVVFDEVMRSDGSGAWGTVFPFVARATEHRWEDGSAAHFSLGTVTGPSSRPEALFPQTKPSGAHIKISTDSWFDLQDKSADPSTSMAAGFHASDTNGNGQNVVTGVLSYSALQNADSSRRKITHGNLVQTKTSYGDGFSVAVSNTEKVTFVYQSPTSANPLTGLAESITTEVTTDSSDYPSETAPVKRYTYWANTALIKTEKIDATDDALDLTKTYDRDERGRIKSSTLSGYNDTGPKPLRHIGEYVASEGADFDADLDQPKTTKNAVPYSHVTSILYHPLLGLPTSVTDMENGTSPNHPKITTGYDALGRVVEKVDTFKSLRTTTTYAKTGSATDWTQTQTQTISGLAGHTGSSISGVVALALSSAYAVQTKQTSSGSETAYTPIAWTYYDRLGRVIRTVKENYSTVANSSARTITDTVYNNLGHVIAVSLPYPSGSSTILWTKTTYDALGRVSTVTTPNGTVTTSTYNGRATTVEVNAPNLGGVDPVAQTLVTLVDAKGRTVKVWNNDKNGSGVPAFSDTKGTTDTAPSITFSLDGFGRMRKTSFKGQTATVDALYDQLGNQSELTDPDKGRWVYLNNALGRVVKQTDAKNTVTEFVYDRLGRLLTRVATEAAPSTAVESAAWFYYDRTANPALNLSARGTRGWVGAPHYDRVAMTGAPGYVTGEVAHVYFYDALGRPEIKLSRIDGQHFYTKTSYDEYSRPRTVWPAWRPESENPISVTKAAANWGYTYTYNAKGYVTDISDSEGRVWWNNPVYDHVDRIESVRKGGAYYTQRSYRPEDGVLTAIKTGTTLGAATLQNLTFNYDGMGNLTSRTGPGGTETFGYDAVNRLTSSSKQGATNYLENGNIDTKVDVAGVASSAYTYLPTKPHAVQTARGYTMGYDANGNVNSRTHATSGESWNISYTGFDKPRWMAKTVGVTTVGSEFIYDAARSRAMHLEFDTMAGGVPLRYKSKKIYTAGAAAEVDYKLSTDGTSWQLDKTRFYVPAPDGTAGAMVYKTSVATADAQIYHHDHLGSIEAITPYGDTSNNLAPDQSSAARPSRYSYDAWGERRDTTDWAGKPTATTLGGDDDLSPRGYTGHEMLDELGLVHMNGRIYDPLLGRMLSADIVVQAPGNLQAYNRYSYVMNNPATYTDPTGFFWDPNSGWWGKSEWGIFGKAAVVDPAVEGYKSGSLSFEKGFTEWENAKTSGTPVLDRTLAVLHIASGTGEGVSIVSDYVPGGKQVKGTATVLAKNADEIGEAASRMTKMIAGKTDDAAGGLAKAERKLDDVAISAKKVDVDTKIAPTNLKETPKSGVYEIRGKLDGKDKGYTGSGKDIDKRLDDPKHPARKLMDEGQDVTITKRPVDVSDAASNRESQQILRTNEQMSMDEMAEEGREMLNKIRARAEEKFEKDAKKFGDRRQ